MPEILIFGAGNIGRAFIGQVFSKNSYKITFADIQKDIIEELNAQKSYPVVIRQNDETDQVINVSPVRAISVLDKVAIRDEFHKADIVATSVGLNAIPKIAPLIALGVMDRIVKDAGPIDLILAENIHNGKDFLLSELKKHLPSDLDVEKHLGIIQTSIGKMVPIVTDEDKKIDPLLVASEPYNELILDKYAFLNPIPDFPEILAVSPIEAYADRKIFIHNLGHAITAYLGFLNFPEEKFIADILKHELLLKKVKLAMNESAAALLMMYPKVFDKKGLDDYIDDLLKRFQNKALGDTVFRVGRDLSRKLNSEDRIMGAIRNCEAFHLPWNSIGEAFLSAFYFKATDDTGNPSDRDVDFLRSLTISETSFIKLCGLNERDPIDSRIIEKILKWRKG